MLSLCCHAFDVCTHVMFEWDNNRCWMPVYTSSIHTNKPKGNIWVFPKMMVPNNHGFSYWKWSFWGVLGVPPFKETPIYTRGFTNFAGLLIILLRSRIPIFEKGNRLPDWCFFNEENMARCLAQVPEKPFKLPLKQIIGRKFPDQNYSFWSQSFCIKWYIIYIYIYI